MTLAFSATTNSVILAVRLKKEPREAKSRKTNILLLFGSHFFPFYRMPFWNLLFYRQCCDVNQPLHPLVRAIPTLGEASGSGPGHWLLFQSFLGSWLGQEGDALAAPCAALPFSASIPWVALSPPSHLGLCILRLCTQIFKIQPQKTFPCETSQAEPHETLASNVQCPESLAALAPGHAERSGSPPRCCRAPPACTKCLCPLRSWKDSYPERIHTFHFSVRFLCSVR